MRTNCFKLALIACVALGGSASLHALPLQRHQIPPKVAWFLHLDVDKLKETQLGQFLLTEMDKPENQSKLASFQALFNFDPRKKLKDCTLYSLGSTPEDAVLVMQGEFDTNRLTMLAKAGQGSQTSQRGDHTIYSWLDPKRKNKAGEPTRTYGALSKAGLLVLGQKEHRVGDALGFLDRSQATPETSRLLPDATAPAKSLVLVGGAHQSELGALPANMAFLKNFKTMKLVAGENSDDCVVDLAMEAENEDAAKNMLAIGQGLLAWAAFQGDRGGNNQILQGLTTDQKGALVKLGLKMPATALIQMIKDGAARKTSNRQGQLPGGVRKER